MDTCNPHRHWRCAGVPVAGARGGVHVRTRAYAQVHAPAYAWEWVTAPESRAAAGARWCPIELVQWDTTEQSVTCSAFPVSRPFRAIGTPSPKVPHPWQ